MTRAEATELLERYKENKCTADEIAWIESWYQSFNENKTQSLTQKDFIEAEYRMMEKLNISSTTIKRKLWPKVSAIAASIILIAGLSIYYVQIESSKNSQNQTITSLKDIKPGKNRATLVLANGHKINLDASLNGKLAEESGVIISKNSAGEIVYDMTSSNASVNNNSYNTIITPKGGTYEVLLEDGSKIWINAASNIRFPAKFSPKERLVELQGEAYFEVAKNPKSPFKVLVNNQIIEVLGTKFNVNGYRNEVNLATTLAEGSIKLSNSNGTAILKPGQQALSKNNSIILKNVNADEFLAWKEGVFSFNNADLPTVMRQLERWYNIDVKFNENAPDILFTGKIYKNLNLDDALSNLTFLGVRFSIKDRTVIVLSNN